jgi:hypothetical protein
MNLNFEYLQSLKKEIDKMSDEMLAKVTNDCWMETREDVKDSLFEDYAYVLDTLQIMGKKEILVNDFLCQECDWEGDINWDIQNEQTICPNCGKTLEHNGIDKFKYY